MLGADIKILREFRLTGRLPHHENLSQGYHGNVKLSKSYLVRYIIIQDDKYVLRPESTNLLFIK